MLPVASSVGVKTDFDGGVAATAAASALVIVENGGLLLCIVVGLPSDAAGMALVTKGGRLNT